MKSTSFFAVLFLLGILGAYGCQDGLIPNGPNCGYSTGYLGCWADSAPRDLIYQNYAAYGVKPCQASCKSLGYRYSGSQYGSQCFCGNKYGSYGPKNNCDMPCANNASEICGGTFANSVYQTCATPCAPGQCTSYDVCTACASNRDILLPNGECQACPLSQAPAPNGTVCIDVPINATISVIPICHGDDAAISAFAYGGTGNDYVFVWVAPNSSVVSTQAYVNDVVPGTWILYVFDGANSNVTIPIFIANDPLEISITGTNATTPNGYDGSLTATASGANLGQGYEYRWFTYFSDSLISGSATMNWNPGLYQVTVRSLDNPTCSGVAVGQIFGAAFTDPIITLNCPSQFHAGDLLTCTYTMYASAGIWMFSLSTTPSTELVSGIQTMTFSTPVYNYSNYVTYRTNPNQVTEKLYYQVNSYVYTAGYAQYAAANLFPYSYLYPNETVSVSIYNCPPVVNIEDIYFYCNISAISRLPITNLRGTAAPNSMQGISNFPGTPNTYTFTGTIRFNVYPLQVGNATYTLNAIMDAGSFSVTNTASATVQIVNTNPGCIACMYVSCPSVVVAGDQFTCTTNGTAVAAFIWRAYLYFSNSNNIQYVSGMDLTNGYVFNPTVHAYGTSTTYATNPLQVGNNTYTVYGFYYTENYQYSMSPVGGNPTITILENTNNPAVIDLYDCPTTMINVSEVSNFTCRVYASSPIPITAITVSSSPNVGGSQVLGFVAGNTSYDLQVLFSFSGTITGIQNHQLTAQLTIQGGFNIPDPSPASVQVAGYDFSGDYLTLNCPQTVFYVDYDTSFTCSVHAHSIQKLNYIYVYTSPYLSTSSNYIFISGASNDYNGNVTFFLNPSVEGVVTYQVYAYSYTMGSYYKSVPSPISIEVHGQGTPTPSPAPTPAPPTPLPTPPPYCNSTSGGPQIPTLTGIEVQNDTLFFSITLSPSSGRVLQGIVIGGSSHPACAFSPIIIDCNYVVIAYLPWALHSSCNFFQTNSSSNTTEYAAPVYITTTENIGTLNGEPLIRTVTDVLNVGVSFPKEVLVSTETVVGDLPNPFAAITRQEFRPTPDRIGYFEFVTEMPWPFVLIDPVFSTLPPHMGHSPIFQNSTAGSCNNASGSCVQFMYFAALPFEDVCSLTGTYAITFNVGCRGSGSCAVGNLTKTVTFQVQSADFCETDDAEISVGVEIESYADAGRTIPENTFTITETGYFYATVNSPATLAQTTIEGITVTPLSNPGAAVVLMENGVPTSIGAPLLPYVAGWASNAEFGLVFSGAVFEVDTYEIDVELALGFADNSRKRTIAPTHTTSMKFNLVRA